MTPREVEELSATEYSAFWRYAEKQTRDTERELRRARKGARG
jgi:hypothetical protein